VVMDIDPAPGTDGPSSYEQLVKLLRDKNCVSHRCTWKTVL
jgi:hypothetical protein